MLGCGVICLESRYKSCVYAACLRKPHQALRLAAMASKPLLHLRQRPGASNTDQNGKPIQRMRGCGVSRFESRYKPRECKRQKLKPKTQAISRLFAETHAYRRTPHAAWRPYLPARRVDTGLWRYLSGKLLQILRTRRLLA